MSIAVADNFQYKGGKPLDARMKFATILDMTAAPVADLYDGCFSYVVAEQKYYSYDSNNENDPHLGKWREYSSGGAEYSDFTGATSQAAGAHGLVPAPTTADVDKYLKGDGSWGAISMPNFDYSNEFGAENILSLTEKMIGQWTDGKPLYQKTYHFTESSEQTSKNYSIQNLGVEYVKLVSGEIKFGVAGGNGWHTQPFYGGSSSNSGVVVNKDNINVYANGWKFTEVYATIQYTKTTDSAMSIGTPNDYSTTEKIVGTWIDGKPIWQKTITGLSIIVDQTSWTSPLDLSISIDTLLNAVCYGNGGIYVPREYYYGTNGLALQGNGNSNRSINTITIQYTKTS